MILKRGIATLALLLLTSFVYSAEYKNEFQWEKHSQLIDANDENFTLGVSASFGGLSNGTVIIAGGCNFPTTPVVDGGEKVYYDNIYILKKGSKSWESVSQLPSPIAYGASTTTPSGVLCVGGNNSDGRSDKAFLLKYSGGEINIKALPNLPYGIANCDITTIGNIAYLVGGDNDGEQKNNFLSLDLSKPNKWEILEAYPGKKLSQPVAIAQNSAEHTNIYVASDRLLYYNPTLKCWNEGSVIKPKGCDTLSLQGSSGFAIGGNNIMFVGGVNRQVYANAVEQEKKGSAEWKREYLSHEAEWYKFNKEVVVYNTITNTWSVADRYPFAPPAGAKVVKTASDWLIVGGEIKPGVRSNAVYSVRGINTPTFGAVNWSVLAVYMLSMLYIGYYFMRKNNKNTDDFFKGGGRIPWWASGISLFATMLSAITFMAIPAKTFATDWRLFPTAVTILIMAFPVIKYYLPFFKRLNVTTAYEYLESRFNYTSRFIASTLFIVFMIARMALTLFLPSLALSTVTGIDIYLCIILMGIITLIYSTMGGVEAVIWGDVIQGFILLGGALFVAVYLLFEIPGGVSTMIDIVVTEDKMRMFDFSFVFTSATFWVVILGGLTNNLISYSSDQTTIQRYITTNSEKEASKSIMLNGILSVFVSVVFYFIGTALYVFYKSSPEKVNYMMQNNDAIFPHFIMAEIPIGLAGLIIAAIFAATMSTVSSNINSLSTAYTIDLHRKFSKNSNDRKELQVARWSGVIMGSIGIFVALLMATLNILSIFDFFNFLLGLLSGGIAGLFFIGIFLPRVGHQSALIGFVLGAISLFIISSFTPISFWLYGFIGVSLTVIFALIASIFFKNNKNITGLTWKTISKL